jgi:hypothetical protein
MPGRRPCQDLEDFVELTVDGSGRYQAVAARTIGAMDAQGKVGVLSNGKILFRETVAPKQQRRCTPEPRNRSERS